MYGCCISAQKIMQLDRRFKQLVFEMILPKIQFSPNHPLRHSMCSIIDKLSVKTFCENRSCGRLWLIGWHGKCEQNEQAREQLLCHAANFFLINSNWFAHWQFYVVRRCSLKMLWCGSGSVIECGQVVDWFFPNNFALSINKLQECSSAATDILITWGLIWVKIRCLPS